MDMLANLMQIHRNAIESIKALLLKVVKPLGEIFKCNSRSSCRVTRRRRGTRHGDDEGLNGGERSSGRGGVERRRGKGLDGDGGNGVMVVVGGTTMVVMWLRLG
ncbi:hypothetical protein GOBAR_AA34295 [Gossypium barbadense]|uniref:Uncharacterized protein n=1 Tax=Gossypium barbadense TaxID=3634 RepID=A0A2P5W5L9_GOSBA|nr:hypothetical protein GOBAR_AA34295 [Gossypium barbadense]